MKDLQEMLLELAKQANHAHDWTLSDREQVRKLAGVQECLYEIAELTEMAVNEASRLQEE